MTPRIYANHVVVDATTTMIGGGVSPRLDDLFETLDTHIMDLTGDRNAMLGKGGVLSFSGTSLSITENLTLELNSTSGGSPVSVDLGAGPFSLSANNTMIYAVVNRTGGTATVFSNASSLPTLTAANSEVFILAKRKDDTGGAKRVYLRGGSSLSENGSAELGNLTRSYSPAFAQVATPSTPPSGFSRLYPKSDGFFYSLDPSGNEVKIGSGSGSINYATNSDAESNTNGWGSYNENKTVTFTNGSANITISSTTGYTVGQRISFTTTGTIATQFLTNTTYYIVSIVNGTTFTASTAKGGTATVALSTGTGTHTVHTMDPILGTGGSLSGLTFSRSTSSPLRGTGSFLLAQTNSTVVQGQGLNCPFTIDSADKAKVINVELDFNASSTFVASSGLTGSDSDLGLYVYDVTNGVLIPLTPSVITANGANNFTYNGSFQAASNSTSYRLLIHAVTSNANATGWTFKFDNVKIGPQTAARGTFDEDWNTNRTFTTNGFGTISSVQIQSKRQGDWLHVRGTFIVGTPAASTAYIQLPISIDSSKISTATNGQEVGRAFRVQGSQQTVYDGASAAGQVLFYDGSTTDKVFFAYRLGNTANQFTKDNGNTIISTGELCSFSFSVPIAGWSSNTLLSTDADTRVVAARYTSAAGQSVTNGNTDVVDFGTKDFDTHSAVTTGASWKFTAPVSGYYWVSAKGLTDATTSLGATSFDLYKNGSAYATGRDDSKDSSNNSRYGLKVETSVYLKAGDYVDIRLSNGSGGTRTLVNDGFYIYVSVNRMSGPAALAASEKVIARAHASSTSITSSYAKVVWTTEDKDSHSMFTSGTFTVPSAGDYQVNASLQLDATYSASQHGDIAIYKNGVIWSESIGVPLNSANAFPRISDIVTSCLPGDTIEIYALSTGGSPSIASNNVRNFVSITRT